MSLALRDLTRNHRDLFHVIYGGEALGLSVKEGATTRDTLLGIVEDGTCTLIVVPLTGIFFARPCIRIG